MLFSYNSYAEKPDITELPGDGIGASYHYGKILKHREYFRPEVKGPTNLVSFNYEKQTDGSFFWHEYLNYPRLGISLIAGDFGDREVFGRIYGFSGNVSFCMLRRSFVDIYFTLSTGLAFIDRQYHPVDNFDNNVIGSKLNNYTAFSFSANWRLINQWRLISGVSYHHFSNGNYQKANLGINVPVVFAGLQYEFQEVQTEQSPLTETFNAFNFFVRAGFGMHEGGLPGGPKYPVYTTSLAGGYSFSPVSRLFVGVDATYDIAKREFLIMQEIESGNEAVLNSIFGSVIIGNELLLGKLGIYKSLGFYVLKSDEFTNKIFTKIGLQYYPFVDVNIPAKGFFIGTYLKSHQAVADFVEFGAGWQF